MFDRDGLGLEMILHALPFQCSVSVRVEPALSRYSPTAHTFFLAATVTALNVLNWFPTGLGLVTTFQVVPFQRSVSVSAVPLLSMTFPMAHTLVLETAATPFRTPFTGVELGTTVQVLPSQCSMSVCSVLLLSTKSPTAHTSSSETADTPWR